MIEFLQTYGVWLLLGALFILMMRAHGSHGGMGCGMGSHQDHGGQSTTDATDTRDDSTATRPTGKQPGRDEVGTGANTSHSSHRSGGCH